ncbi:gastric triacylglycerol lipase-like [Temnothorax curvispinosus]|uniref:Gastric triacylglycerol lipase-like n=1 Tax=Temnothorax curvispinosus TaxID=300111 RepID=A0A6J1PRV3_9HYME|nr:gastric triacylglycerol lipase-like [Temnothorax curvispinosus]
MMTSGIKFMLVAFLIILTFSKGRLQTISSFLQTDFLNFFFSKDSGLMRVRRMDPAEKINSGKVLDFIGLVERYDYPAEEHSVTTEDGYNLKIHRIPGSPLLLDSKKKKEIVFVQHGLLASSDCWVLYGPGKDLAFLLADQGYDVWIGNMRGNNYCRSHVNMTTYDPKFWQYSFYEIGTKDLPAMFDYILNYTKQKDLYYIGHSMGSAALLVLLSSKPEYNIKIKMAICLAPTSFWMKVSPAVNEFANILPTFKEVLRERETYDVFPQSLATVTVGRMLCNDNTMTQFICVTILFIIGGPDPAQLNTVSCMYCMSLLFIPAEFSQGVFVRKVPKPLTRIEPTPPRDLAVCDLLHSRSLPPFHASSPFLSPSLYPSPPPFRPYSFSQSSLSSSHLHSLSFYSLPYLFFLSPSPPSFLHNSPPRFPLLLLHYLSSFAPATPSPLHLLSLSLLSLIHRLSFSLRSLLFALHSIHSLLYPFTDLHSLRSPLSSLRSPFFTLGPLNSVSFNIYNTQKTNVILCP